MLARYFERMKAIVERHGGTVEKFIGDAVMAVFGVPAAARGRRAAGAARRASRCATRVHPSSGMRGAAIGVDDRRGRHRHRGAARDRRRGQRRRSAGAGGAAGRDPDRASETLRLARDAVDVERARAARAEGQGRAGRRVPAARPSGRRAAFERHARTRRWSGAQRELATADRALRAGRLATAACQLVHGPRAGGVGKSRLAAEFLGVARRRAGRSRAAASPTARASPTGRVVEVRQAAPDGEPTTTPP